MPEKQHAMPTGREAGWGKMVILNPRHLLYKKLGGAQSRSKIWRQGIEFFPCLELSAGHRACNYKFRASYALFNPSEIDIST